MAMRQQTPLNSFIEGDKSKVGQQSLSGKIRQQTLEDAKYSSVLSGLWCRV